jgi:hypothetical protein
MKEKRLKTLNDCLRAIQDAYDVLEEVRDEEQEAYDNMPEGLQYSERGDMMQDAIDCLDEAVDAVDEVISNLENAISSAQVPDVMEIDPWQKLEIGDVVKHKSFGSGVVISINNKEMSVRFASKTSRFFLPDAFEKGFLTI